MKKIFLSVAVLAVLASCGTSTQKAEDKGAELKAKIENCTDPDSLAVYVKQAQEYADQLVKEGKDQAAADYLNEVAPVLEAKGAQGAGILDQIKDKADEAVNTATEAVDSVKAGVNDAVDKASATVEDVKAKGEDAVEKGKEAVEAGKDAAKNAADAAKNATDAAKNAIKGLK